MKFTLTTDLGDLDLLGDVPGVGGYAAVAEGASALDVGGLAIQVMDPDALTKATRAAGRAKDLFDLVEIAEIKKRSS